MIDWAFEDEATHESYPRYGYLGYYFFGGDGCGDFPYYGKGSGTCDHGGISDRDGSGSCGMVLPVCPFEEKNDNLVV
ncbi:MAG: hypothetical protein VW405_19455 [Rhodospirillaceae bacterium]